MAAVNPWHPVIIRVPPTKITNANSGNNCLRLRPIKHMPTAKLVDANWNSGLRTGGRLEVWVAVWMVITVARPALPGTTVAGMKKAVAPGGSPEADIVTTPLNVPPAGATRTVTFAEPPGVTVRGVDGAVSVKVGAVWTVKAKADEVEGAKMTLPE